MQSHLTSCVLFITLSSIQLTIGKNLPEVIHQGNKSPIATHSSSKPILLGQVEKTTYYVSNRQTYLNWYDAKAFCEQSGMSLGTIKSPTQQQFLRQMKHVIGNPNQGYWIAARDVLAETQFVWDIPETPVTNVGQTWDFNTPPHTAIVFWSTLVEAYNGHWFAIETELKFRVICEMT